MAAAGQYAQKRRFVGRSVDAQLASKSLLAVLLIGLFPLHVFSTTFTLLNNCPYQIWPGVTGTPSLGTGGFALAPGQSTVLNPSPGWSGRVWARTGCRFDQSSGQGSCTTGDCGGVLECRGAGGAPPVTLAEFTLGNTDFYDVSLVDGYNLPLAVSTSGVTANAAASRGSSTTVPCATAGCTSNALLRNGGGGTCPTQLVQTDSAGQAVACRSACEAFAAPQYCCTGAYSTPQTCGPSSYSQLFKSACPTAYSYAYDDPSSTFTCSGAAGYIITFCPTSSK